MDPFLQTSRAMVSQWYLEASGTGGFQVRNPIPPKILRECALVYVKSDVKSSNVRPLMRRGVWRGSCSLKCHPRHLTTARNYENRPKIASVLLLNGTLI
ncbi:hypothetical protein AVEN_191092-1 [Araneus ventricosus]|uniref:Uncharacterized protein n=1 Tax=Araneus ventricosus TaxID=182803 RepID=A0A4Y2AX42_ARAVE|nr:hypothetical protein AVEN_191092-1 [Araneus ventricosus]